MTTSPSMSDGMDDGDMAMGRVPSYGFDLVQIPAFGLERLGARPSCVVVSSHTRVVYPRTQCLPLSAFPSSISVTR